MLRLGAMAAVAMGALAVVQQARGDSARTVQMLIAAALGLGFISLLGIAILMLMLSRRRLEQDMTALDDQRKDDDDIRI
jgi:hypothetical protein